MMTTRDDEHLPGWTHSTDEIDIHERTEFADDFSIVPSFEVHVLPDEFDGRLSTVRFQCRHVQVIDEEEKDLAQGWTIDTATSVNSPWASDSLCLVFPLTVYRVSSR
jgi:hypothetical protein